MFVPNSRQARELKVEIDKVTMDILHKYKDQMFKSDLSVGEWQDKLTREVGSRLVPLIERMKKEQENG